MRQSAPARYAVKRTRQKTGKFTGHWFRPAPVFLGEICPNGQILAPAPFLFWTVHGPFSLFGATEKRKWGVQSQARRARRAVVPGPRLGKPPSRPRGAASPVPPQGAIPEKIRRQSL